VNVGGDDRAELVRERFERDLGQRLARLLTDEVIAEHAARPLGPHSDELSHVLTHFRRAPIEGKHLVLAVERDGQWRVGRVGRTNPAAEPLVLEPESYDSYEAALHAAFLQRVAELRERLGDAAS
jgi:branched-chain amino acid transport system permease protein